MKRFLLSVLVLLAAVAFGASNMAGRSFLVKMLPEIWLSGEGPKAWRPGHLYVFEYWATWCYPCQQAAPHVAELYEAVRDAPTVHFYSISKDDDSEGREALLKKIDNFFARLPKDVRPTYPLGVDPKGVHHQSCFREVGYFLGGVPTLVLVAEGKLREATHPNGISVEKLLEHARATKAADEAKWAPLIDAWHRKANDAARREAWEEAAEWELKVLRRVAMDAWDVVPEDWRPSDDREPEAFFPPSLPEPADATTLGDAGAFAYALGEPFPVDDAMTIVSLLTPPEGFSSLSYQQLSHVPGVLEGRFFPEQQRRIFLAAEEQRAALEAFLAKWPGEVPKVTFVPRALLWELWEVSAIGEGPLFAVFRSGELLWKGRYTEVPESLRTLAPDVKTQRAWLEAEMSARAAFQKSLKQANKRQSVAFWLGRFTQAPTDVDRAGTVKPFFEVLRAQNRLPLATRVIRQTLEKGAQAQATLRAMEEVLETWPALAQVLEAERVEMAKAIAEAEERIAPERAAEAYRKAASMADRMESFSGDTLRRKALEVDMSMRRWRRFQNGLPALPLE